MRLPVIRRHFLLASGALAHQALGRQAPPLPTLRVLTGFPPGGSVDVLARATARQLRGAYARTVLVENRPGAGGRLAVEDLTRSAADGSTLLLTPTAMITLFPHLYSRLPYALADVVPVCGASTSELALAIGPQVPDAVRSLPAFIGWLRDNPDSALFGSPGAGTPPHLLGALLAKEAGVTLSHVPYRGTLAALQEVAGGQLAALVGPVGSLLGSVESGRVRVLATSGPVRSRQWPQVPTFVELGFGALEWVEWYGFFLPRGADAALVASVSAQLRTALLTAEAGQALAAVGLEVAATSAEQFAETVRREHAAWAPIIRRAGFTPGT